MAGLPYRRARRDGSGKKTYSGNASGDLSEPEELSCDGSMAELSQGDLRAQLDTLYRAEAGRIRATLIRLLGNFDAAEDAMHDAFRAALHRWAAEGVPANPRAWLISTARFKAIDAFRRRARLDAAQDQVVAGIHSAAAPASENEDWGDDRLRLLFTCCHPSIPLEARTALALREVCGLTTEEIARVFLVPASTIAQRIVRAKALIRDEQIPYQIPDDTEMPERLGAVLAVVYLLFNEGYSATAGASLTRADLSREAIRLGRLLVDLMPVPEAMGLLALMLLQESRREARTGDGGDLILLEAQDRSRWDRDLIREGVAWVERALTTRGFGPYTLQAAIAAVHADAPSSEATDWRQICALYAALAEMQPSPVVELNRAVAVAMDRGAEAGLALIEALLARGELRDYHLAHAASADLCRRLGRVEEARAAYERACAGTASEPERRFLQKRIRELG